MEEIFYDTSLVTPAWVEAVRRTLTTRSPLARRVVQVARSAKRSNLESRLGQIGRRRSWCGARTIASRRRRSPNAFAALIPNAELVFIANCGHAPMLEQPSVFNAVVEDWLQDTRTGRRQTATEQAR